MRRRMLALDAHGKYVYRQGRRLLNLASNDYLGLATHPHLKQAVSDAALKFGTGAGASRLVVGHTVQHAALEQRFAELKHAQAALLLPTGYMANLAVLTVLARPCDLVLQDKLNHASLIDAARFTDAEVRTFPHRNYDKLERLLARFRELHPVDSADPEEAQPLIVTDSIFSMDGDAADLPAICDIAERHHAMVIVDEAHGTGVLGEHGAGLCELQQVAERVDVVVSTASKGLGALGGIVTASKLIVDTLVNHARPFIYTTAVPPTQVAAIDAALDVLVDEPERRGRLAIMCEDVFAQFRSQGWPLEDREIPSPIFPLVVHKAEAALAAAHQLEQDGILAVAIRPPTVPRNTSRIRLSLRADLTDTELDRIITAVGKLRRQVVDD